MLVLSRKEGESIRIGDDIAITVVRTAGDKVRIGIEAPSSLLVLRGELKDRAIAKLSAEPIAGGQDGAPPILSFEVSSTSSIGISRCS